MGEGNIGKHNKRQELREDKWSHLYTVYHPDTSAKRLYGHPLKSVQKPHNELSGWLDEDVLCRVSKARLDMWQRNVTRLWQGDLFYYSAFKSNCDKSVFWLDSFFFHSSVTLRVWAGNGNISDILKNGTDQETMQQVLSEGWRYANRIMLR